ncbi:methyltransferase domain-containing protein [Achromobacter sp.]|uniref:methyltransferase domain-containing protein n=1 Tax=Achromobacter sp. TaxID=134375 RepID=UPI0028AEA7C0|nr:methyltransferase domain-containing protein [Achromobacter sp.]
MVKKMSPHSEVSIGKPTVRGGIERVIRTCGLSNVLSLGRASSAHVAALLKQGVEAVGLPESPANKPIDNEHVGDGSLFGSVVQLPFKDREFGTVLVVDCLEYLPVGDMEKALAEIRRVANRYVWLQVATTHAEQGPERLTVEDRAWWERLCFQAGFRKHPAYYLVNDYEGLNNDGSVVCILLERMPDAAEAAYPLSSLDEERSLHMDMFRDTGTRSDAHIGRYHFAANYVRPGDVVLDAACGLGYGTYTLKGLTAASSFRGIDGNASAIAYANTCYGQDQSISFSEGFLPDCLNSIPDNSVDVVVCFETLEHVERPVDVLKEFHRILTPGGRIISSVPNDWSDETGEDPNPYHFHVYDIPKFTSQMEGYFDVEHLFGQTADRVKLANGKCEWERRPRQLREIPLDRTEGVESEWLLAVAAKSPIGSADVPYSDKGYTEEECVSTGNALAFARDYKNPWLVRSMVAMGSRTSNGRLREKWARQTLNESLPDSPDAGAALCVLAYLALNREVVIDADMNEAIGRYIAAGDSANPSVLRWKVSLAYVQGLLSLSFGDRDEAKKQLRWVLDANVESFSVTLLTKPAQAGYLLGLLEAADGDLTAARQTWRQAAVDVQSAMAQYFSAPNLTPAPFVLRETSTAMLFCGRILAADKYSARLAKEPAAFFSNAVNDYLSEIERLTSLALKFENQLLAGPTGNPHSYGSAQTISSQAAQLTELRKYVLALEQSRNEQKIQMEELRQYIADLEENRSNLMQQLKRR